MKAVMTSVAAVFLILTVLFALSGQWLLSLGSTLVGLGAAWASIERAS